MLWGVKKKKMEQLHVKKWMAIKLKHQSKINLKIAVPEANIPRAVGEHG